MPAEIILPMAALNLDMRAESLVFEGSGTLFAEYVGNNSLSPSPTFILLGARSPFINGTKLDFGYAFGLNEKSIKNSLSAGLHCEF